MILLRLRTFAGMGAILAASHAQGQQPKNYQGKCSDAGCHEALIKRAFLHAPAEPGSCDTCHEQTDEPRHAFKLTLDGAELCEDCHDAFSGKVQHQPAAEGQCTACHDPHASNTRHLLTAETLSELCTECHDDFSESRKFLHGPVAAGACTTCHNPHASEHAALLQAEGKQLCDQCHTAMKDRINTKEFQHSPASEDCTNCHDPHGADNRLNLKSQAPELCLDCHDDIGDVIEDATVSHDAVKTGRSCPNCHDPHASDVEKLLVAEPMDLCLSCHNKEIESGDGKIFDIAQFLQDNPEHHGPIRSKNCTACHSEIHGGDRFWLLMGEYPTGFYAPFEEERYAFCFECHESDMVQDERTDTLTNFRNGDRNLHYLHVNRKTKGRTCRACHNTHASRRPKHITETVPFGKWEIPTNFKKSESGGSCLPGCHKLYRYDRNSPIENLPA